MNLFIFRCFFLSYFALTESPACRKISSLKQADVDVTTIASTYKRKIVDLNSSGREVIDKRLNKYLNKVLLSKIHV
jgi:hypothetical protein